jgi:hypothetical protein
MDNNKILLVNLSKGALGEDVSSLLGLLIVSKLALTSLSRENIPEADRVPHGVGAQIPSRTNWGLAGLLYRTRCEIGMPSCVIRLITEEATRASTCCAANFRARSVGPIRVL